MGVSRPAKPSPVSDLSFEQAMEQLEAIIDRVEGGQIGLEQALAEYERGVALKQRCQEILRQVEQRVEELGKIAGEAGKGSSGRSAAADSTPGGTGAEDDEAPF